jgi:hypothetical protein
MQASRLLPARGPCIVSTGSKRRRRMRRIVAVVVIALVPMVALAQMGEDAGSLMDTAKAAYEAGKHKQAIEDLQWAIKEINKIRLAQLREFLPEGAEGYEVRDTGGEDVAAATMLGLQVLEVGREFAKDDLTVEVKITIGEVAGTGFGAWAKFAQAFGATEGEQLVRIQGRKCTATFDSEEMTGTLKAALEDDLVVEVNCNGCSESGVLEEFANKINFDELEESIQ